MLTACGQHASVASVDPLAEEYFEALKEGNLDKAMDMYSEDFFERFPKEIWREKLQRLSANLGPIKAYSFRNKQADSRYSGKFYIYQYDTIHESDGKEKRAKHTITFIQPIDRPEIKIAGHMIKAQGFD
jgi:NAD-dependent SIR2 family protein deacetylase